MRKLNELQKNELYSNLYGFYGKLLTKRQQDYFEDYYYSDLSLGEIADNHGVSRQAVFDNLKRSCKLLNNFETKLRMKSDDDFFEQSLQKCIDSLNVNDYVATQSVIEVMLSRLKGE